MENCITNATRGNLNSTKDFLFIKFTNVLKCTLIAFKNMGKLDNALYKAKVVLLLLTNNFYKRTCIHFSDEIQMK